MSPEDQLRSIAVQASLLGAGSLDAVIVHRLPRRPKAVRRYLAVEGHRALAAQELLLPRSARSLIDRGEAARSDSPAASLNLASSLAGIGDPPAVFGTIRPREMRNVDPPAEAAVVEHIPRRDRDEILRELDDGEDDEHEPIVVDVSSPVGGGGAIGRLLKRLLSDSRASSAGGGPLGADEPTHVTKRATGGGRTVAAEERHRHGACYIGRAGPGEGEAVHLAQVHRHLGLAARAQWQGIDSPAAGLLGGAPATGDARPSPEGEALEAPKDVGEQRVGAVQPGGGSGGYTSTAAGHTCQREGVDGGGGQRGTYQRA